MLNEGAGRAGRIVISICGASGSGKSQLSKVLVAHLGSEASVRIPGDYYLLPACGPLADYFRTPLHYDWPLLDAVLSVAEATTVTTPDFDFVHFRRRGASAGKTFALRRIAIVDTMYSYPHADLYVLLTAPDDLRWMRVVARDNMWGTCVHGRWSWLELAKTHLAQLAITYDLTLSGITDPVENAGAIVALLHQRGYCP